MCNLPQLKDVDSYIMKSDYIQVTCGCTSYKFGDLVGQLKITKNGEFIIDCQCIKDCPKKGITPYAFEKHARREGPQNWRNHIWVHVSDEKVPLGKTDLINYYKAASDEASSSGSRRGKGVFHRDEFIRCSVCNKDRRFRLQKREDHRVYHDAVTDEDWNCSKIPFDSVSCEDPEERASRKSCRGCPRKSKCNGCTSCVCLGCDQCRFADCSCRECRDFNQTAKP